MTERKRLTVAAFTVGWLVIASGTAGAVVAIGHGGSGSSASAEAAPSATPSSSATPSASPTTTQPTTSAPTTIPSPTSTVHGTVSGSTHKGDLRYFLVPVPDGGSVIGDPDGKKLTKSDISQQYSNSKEVVSILGQLGFKDGAEREYQTADAAYHVDVMLYHFSSAGNANLWFQGDQMPSSWKHFSISGTSGAKGYSTVDKGTGLETLRGLYHVGDVVVEIYITGESPVDHSVLSERMSRQVARLKTGK